MFVTESTTTILLHLFGVLVVVLFLGEGNQVSEVSAELGVDVGDGENGSSLLVNNLTQSGLTLNNDVRDTHLNAQSGQPHDDLNRINVVGNNDQLSLLRLNQRSNVVDTHLDKLGLLGISLRLGLLSSIEQTLLLGGLVLRAVSVQNLEQGGSSILVQSVGKLVDHRGDLQAVQQNTVLSLEANIFGPANEVGHIALGGDILTNTEVLGGLFEQGSVLDGDLGVSLLLDTTSLRTS
jgi:hypothetical protein